MLKHPISSGAARRKTHAKHPKEFPALRAGKTCKTPQKAFRPRSRGGAPISARAPAKSLSPFFRNRGCRFRGGGLEELLASSPGTDPAEKLLASSPPPPLNLQPCPELPWEGAQEVLVAAVHPLRVYVPGAQGFRK